MSPRPASLAALALLVVAACASVGERIDADARELRDDLRARGGHDVELERPDVVPEPAGELDDAQVARLVLAAHPRVTAELARLSVSSAQASQAARVRNPTLSAGAMFFDMGTEVDLGLAQPLFDLLLRGKRTQLAEHEHEREAARVTSEILGIVHAARRALVDLRGAHESLALRIEAREARAASLAMARALHDAGNVTDQALAVEDAAFGRAELAVLDAQLDVATAREALIVALGLSRDSAAWTAEQPLAALEPEMQTADVEDRAVRASLGLRAALAATRALGVEAGVARWNRLVPDAEVGVMARHEMEGDWGFGPTLTIGVPVFDLAEASDAAARERLRASMADAAALEVETRSRARTLALRVESLARRAALEEGEHAARLEKVVTATLQQFNAMQIGAFDVIRAKESEIEGRVRRVRTRVDLARARIDLEELLAGRSSADERATSHTDELPFTEEPMQSGGHR